MKKTPRLLTALVVAIAMLGFSAFVSFGGSDDEYRSTTLTKVGDVCPVTSIPTIDGKTVDIRGKVAVLDLFATWCPPCKLELPHLQKDLWEASRDKGVMLIAIGREHSVAEIQKFQDDNKYSFLFAADPKREIYGKFATQYIPRTIVVGRDGHIKYQSIGFDESEFRSLLKCVQTELAKQ